MKNDGGPAFPGTGGPIRTGVDTFSFSSAGMTLRDYFAGQALAGLASATNDQGDWTGADAQSVAHTAYEIADAMLAERAKQ